MDIHINNEQDKVGVSKLRDLVKKVLEQGLNYFDLVDNVEVSLTFADDEYIRFLNGQYRNIHQTTDVLSFALEEGMEFNQIPDYPRVLGDIVISVERAKAQSIEYGHSLGREVGYLAIHGLLHLLGYNHENQTDKKEMRLIEEEIMEKVNLFHRREE